MKNKDTIVVEFTEDNLKEFLNEYYKTHRLTKNKKTGKPKYIIDTPISRSMNKIIVITNRIVQNNHKQNRGLYTEYIIEKMKLETIGISETDLEILFTFPTRARHDLDNYLGGIKEYMDSFTLKGVIKDDDYTVIRSIKASARYEKGVSKMTFTFKNCKYDRESTLESMKKESIKTEKRKLTMSKKKKNKIK